MLHQRMTDARGETDGGLGGKILRGNGAAKPHKTQQRHDQHHADDVGRIAGEDAAVDDAGDNQRNKQLEDNLQQLKKRAEHAFFAIAFKINKKLFQTDTPAL